jgi:hypothetical protein
MPLKVSVGLTKKIGQPDYGSLGASCHVEYEADSVLLFQDLDTFHKQVKAAFVACKQAVNDELHRHQAGDQQDQRPQNNGSNVQHNGNGRSNGQRRPGRKATVSQVRAITSISDRLQLDLASWLNQRYGLRVPGDLSISEASNAIDELKALPAGNSNGGQH